MQPTRRQGFFSEEPAHHHRYGQFHDFGGLEAHYPQIKPALRTLGNIANHHDGEQQENAAQVNPRRPESEITGRSLRQGQHDEEPQTQAQTLSQYQVHTLLPGAIQHDQSQSR